MKMMLTAERQILNEDKIMIISVVITLFKQYVTRPD